jgi:hypothetical protein
VQHALRAFTPRDQKAVAAAAQTLAPNPAVGDITQVISELGVGEALVSTLQDRGIPLPVERALIVPPTSRIGTISDEERTVIRSRSPVGGKYDTPVDRQSAYEILSQRTSATAATTAQAPSGAPAPQATGSGWGTTLRNIIFGTGRRQGMVETMAKSAIRSGGSRIGTALVRGVLGSLLRR